MPNKYYSNVSPTPSEEKEIKKKDKQKEDK